MYAAISSFKGREPDETMKAVFHCRRSNVGVPWTLLYYPNINGKAASAGGKRKESSPEYNWLKAALRKHRKGGWCASQREHRTSADEPYCKDKDSLIRHNG